MSRTSLPILLFALAALLAAPLALAHPHPHPHVHGGFGQGLLHPLLGLDHLLAMLGLGLWAGQQGDRRSALLLPGAFLLAMLVGFGVGLASAPMVAVEFGILGSLLVVGGLVAWGGRLPLATGMALAAAFALFHGHAHGAEMAAGLSGLSFGAGFLLASAVLLAAGVGLERLARRQLPALPLARGAGVGIVLAGLVLVALF
ncbi:HupE/UreJ family protein [Alkalilimnicola ehrlichii MLHE-1]|uniref:HupE/UreJ protein n=1 Tax=Alkalilimnicola ehrlichii (strain ATCC BAA-1101 / DSM 17681 / MLHE-1) TaxID=187272 RepID=Q0ACA2_ALKEH|nr:HupE/UreJ family protein [Alkalilimnicola ehrlichii]ABI55535.1 HupE/UreJ protein [Alkalilimnicola ehrlichii MLHE-1]